MLPVVYHKSRLWHQNVVVILFWPARHSCKVCCYYYCCFLVHTEILLLFLSHIVWLNYELKWSLFSWNPFFFFFLTWKTDKVWLFRFRYFADIFLTVTSRKTTDNICCKWQNSSFQVKIRMLDNLYPPLWAWQLPSS